MSKIRNIKDLRDHALQTLEDLGAGKIKLQQAATHGAMYSSIISTVKSQLDYFKAIGQKPDIEFMGASPIYDLPGSKMKAIGKRKDDDE